jgi:hypothetical protein
MQPNSFGELLSRGVASAHPIFTKPLSELQHQLLLAARRYWRGFFWSGVMIGFLFSKKGVPAEADATLTSFYAAASVR